MVSRNLSRLFIAPPTHRKKDSFYLGAVKKQTPGRSGHGEDRDRGEVEMVFAFW
jgi:hypothetical protein